MKFLSLHGQGTNAEIFETQTGENSKAKESSSQDIAINGVQDALREQLGHVHSFDFAEAPFECDPAPGVDKIFPGPYLSWLSGPKSTETIAQSLKEIHEYMDENGPYDGAMGFSQGAVMIAALHLEHRKQYPFEPPLFRAIIFFSGALQPSELQYITENNLKIKEPTAHIWGGKTDIFTEGALRLRDACEKNSRFEFEHNEGHTIPQRPPFLEGVVATVSKCIDRAIFQN